MNLLGGRLQWRLAVAYLLLALVILGAAGVYIARELKSDVVHDLKAGLLTQAQLASHIIPPAFFQPTNKRPLQDLIRRLGEETGARITVIDGGGKVLADSERTEEEVVAMENHRERPEVREALSRGKGTSFRYSVTLGRPMLYVAISLREEGKVKGFMRLALPVTRLEEATAALHQAVLLGSLLALGLAAILGWAVARHLSRPIARMTELAGCLAKGDFSCCQANPEAPGEIGELGRALNSLAVQLRKKIGDLEQERARAAGVLEGMNEGVMAMDMEGRLVLANPSARRILGLSREDLIGRRCGELIRNEELQQLLEAAILEGIPVRRELTLSSFFSRTPQVLQLYAAPLGDPLERWGAILVLHDLTELRRLEGVRQEFVANVSHELRTPLTSIRGYLETLLEGALEERENARSFLEIAFRHAGRMGRLLDDLLELSNLESGRVRLRIEAVSLVEAAEGALTTLGPQAVKKGVELRHEVPEGLPPALSDRDCLSQILLNLIDNAVKFTPEGGWVNLKTRLLPPDARQDRPLLEMSVEDTGCGISPKDLPRLTERFYRVDKARSRDLGGTGLGLSIVKHLVQLHGGELAIDSWEGQGTRIRFTLPVAPLSENLDITEKGLPCIPGNLEEGDWERIEGRGANGREGGR